VGNEIDKDVFNSLELWSITVNPVERRGFRLVVIIREMKKAFYRSFYGKYIINDSTFECL